jgi:hypothetical protein
VSILERTSRPPAPAGPAAPEQRARRLRPGPLAALAAVFVVLGCIYGWQAARHGTPWLFSDELQYTQLARGVAESGRPELRGEPEGFSSLYPYLAAPAWLPADTGTGYLLAKLLAVVAMTATVVPAYLLARLVVRPWPAVFAAAAAVAVPALSYSSMLLEEPFAYPAATLGFFLVAKALATRSPRWIAAAGAGILLGLAVRTQLAILIPTALLAALGLAWTSGPVRRWRQTWSWREWVGFAVLTLGAVLLFGEIVGGRSESWHTAMHFKGRMLEYALWSLGALTVGIGVLPVLAGFAALARPRGEPPDERVRAFVAVFVGAFVSFVLYAGIKAAYLSVELTTRVAERNVIYLAPLFAVATAIWLERPRLRLWALGLAGAFVGYLMWATPYQLETRFYGDAPGLAVLSTANRHFHWTPEEVRLFLTAVTVIAFLVVAVRALGRVPARLATPLTAAAAAVVVLWGLTAEVAASRASNGYSGVAVQSLPKPLDWIDRATGGAPAMFLGQQIADPNGLWQLEFWNRSLRHMWSIDATAPGPGHVLTPDLAGLDGRLAPQLAGVDYVIVDSAIHVVGTLVARGGPWELYRIEHPLRLRQAEKGIYADGWTGRVGAYHQFSTPGNRPGWVKVTVGRVGTTGEDAPGRVVISVGTLVIGVDKQPQMGAVLELRTWTVHNGQQRTFVIPTPPPPFRVQAFVEPTFVPAQISPGSGDVRELGVQFDVEYSATRPG